MKKIYLSMLLMGAGFFMTHAQSNEGGLPLSNQQSGVQLQQIAMKSYPTPDFSSIIKKEQADELKGVAKPYMVSTGVVADINLKNSGTWSYLENGAKIWRLAVSIPESKALSFFYDQFNLPKGVRLFLTNQSKKQVLGAYTSNNNAQHNNFITEPVQGDVAYLEMNIDAHVDINTIQFHINRIGAYYRGVNELASFATQGATPARPSDEMPGTSPCHLDAVCAIANVAANKYAVPMGASVKIVVSSQGGASGFCSGTLINNTGNEPNGACTPLMLTASHCDGDNYHDNADFAQWQFKFNYYYDSCGGTNLHSPSPTLNGANFKARSNYPSFNSGSQGNSSMVADFLLLELTDPSVTAIQDLYYAGWNRKTDIHEEPNDERYNFFIGYHHPNGDVKKQSWGTSVSPSGTFNQSSVFGTHWGINFIGGGSQPGSSGSGLFDIDGLIIGDLSGGPNSGGACGPTYGKAALYSKLSYAWNNQFDQTTFPAFVGTPSQLKTWLDPINSGQLTLGYAKPDCSNLFPVGINEFKNKFEESIQLYPNPSKTGIINASFNLTNPETIKVTVYNSLGRLVKTFSLGNVRTGSYSFDCSEFSDGIYMMNFSANDVMVGKKFIISK